MLAPRLLFLAAPLALTCAVQAQVGAVVRSFSTPATVPTPVGLDHDLMGNLKLTGIGTTDTVDTIDLNGVSLASFAATMSGNAIGVTTDGTNLYVTDTTGDDVDVYDLVGNYISSFSVATETTFPEGIAWNPTNNHLYVVDGTGGATGNEVIEYDINGTLIAQFPLNGTSIDGIAYDPASQTYWIYDSGTDTVRQYNAAFVEVQNFPGTRAAGFSSGEGVGLIGDQLFVCATGSDTIVQFNLNPNQFVANAAPYGIGCPQPATVYELFSSGTIDLSNQSILFQANGSGGYVVMQGSGNFFAGFANNLGLTDDSVSPPQMLPFIFNHPGGSTNMIDVSSNGRIYLASGTIASSSCCSGNVSTMLSQTSTINPLWEDLNPSAGGGVFFDVDPATGLAHITWDQVPEFGQPNANTVQCTLFPNGSFELNFQTVANATHTCLVGYSAGNNAPDPGPIDYTTQLPHVVTGGTPLRLDSQAGSRPLVGATYNMEVGGIPASATLGLFIYSFTQNAAGMDLTALGMIGCNQYFVTADAIGSFVPAGATAVQSLTIPNSPAFVGIALFAQGGIIAPGINPAGLISSNGLSILTGTL